MRSQSPRRRRQRRHHRPIYWWFLRVLSCVSPQQLISFNFNWNWNVFLTRQFIWKRFIVIVEAITQQYLPIFSGVLGRSVVNVVRSLQIVKSWKSIWIELAPVGTHPMRQKCNLQADGVAVVKYWPRKHWRMFECNSDDILLSHAMHCTCLDFQIFAAWMERSRNDDDNKHGKQTKNYQILHDARHECRITTKKKCWNSFHCNSLTYGDGEDMSIPL